MAPTKLRSPCFFPNLLLSCLNIFLLILSSASIAPILLIKLPPTSLACAFLVTSCISILSALTGFFSQLKHFCFITHISLLLASAVGQLLSLIALFTHERSCLEKLKSSRDPREAKLLIRLESVVLMSMLLIQLLVLVLNCVVHSCWMREYREMEDEKRKKRMGKVEQMEEGGISCKEFGGLNMNSKWVKTDFEG